MMRIRTKMKKKMMRKRRKSWRLVVPQEENIESFLWCMLPHSLSVIVIGIQWQQDTEVCQGLGHFNIGD